MDSICQAVLKGKWPTPRKTYDGVRVVTFYTNQLLDSPGAATEYSESGVQPPTCVAIKAEPCQSPQMSKVKKHVPEKEFTVKINDVCLFFSLAMGPGCCVQHAHSPTGCLLFSYYLTPPIFWSGSCFFCAEFKLIVLGPAKH